MEKENVLIIGAGAVGCGYADELLDHGYKVYIQYRDDVKKLPLLKKHFEGKDVVYIKADHTVKNDVVGLFRQLKQLGVSLKGIVHAAGAAKLDSSENFSSILDSKNFHSEANYRPKVDTLEAYVSVFPKRNPPVDIFLISSWITLDWNEELAQKNDQLGYWISGQKTNTLEATVPIEYEGYFIPYVNHVVRSESPLLKELRTSVKEKSNFEIPEGDDPRINAREILTKARYY